MLGGKFTGGDVATLLWGVIPLVGDATTLIGNAYNWLTGQGFSAFEAALAAIGFGFDVSGNQILGAAASGVLAILKISRSGRGIIANALEFAFNTCMAAGGGASRTLVRPLSTPDPTKAIKCAENAIEITGENWMDFIGDITKAENTMDFWADGAAFQAAIRGQNLSEGAVAEKLLEWYGKYDVAADSPLAAFLSPAGAFYPPGIVDKIFGKHMGNSSGSQFASRLSQQEVLHLIDDAFTQVGQLAPSSVRQPIRVPMRPPAVGNNGETFICLVIGESLEFANRIISAYPVTATGVCSGSS